MATEERSRLTMRWPRPRVELSRKLRGDCVSCVNTETHSSVSYLQPPWGYICSRICYFSTHKSPSAVHLSPVRPKLGSQAMEPSSETLASNCTPRFQPSSSRTNHGITPTDAIPPLS
ncbi:hypothetical protein HZ326_13027 [Fusarium oxysporum f. sp. albedinis]|nr:hypothetical protein HZ326_13027 [Fusarium oxysporum f. sp. albedinis]